MMQRAHNWEYLFNPATGYVQARGSDGSFPPGPAFQPSMLEPGGQLGFEEGNAVQYTWSVPQDLASLAALMGGDGAARDRLDAFFASLNAGRDLPYDWAGNEPSLWTPWEYDYFGARRRPRPRCGRIADELYADAPVDEPGNDDLGALSSWYVWAAMGVYPVTPGTADLALASPLFPEVVLTLPDGRRLTMDAPRGVGVHAVRPLARGQRGGGVATHPVVFHHRSSGPSRRSGVVDPALAPRLDHPDRWDAHLRAGLGARPVVGHRPRIRPSLVPHRRPSRGGLLHAERRDHGPVPANRASSGSGR